MIKSFLVLIFGIACSVGYSQVRSNSISHEFLVDNSEDIVLDSTLTWGELELSFAISDTMHFKGVQIEITDGQGASMINEVYLKEDLLNSESYTKPYVKINFGRMVSNMSYIIRIIELNKNGNSPSATIYNITN